jgi:hypothetical protein
MAGQRVGVGCLPRHGYGASSEGVIVFITWGSAQKAGPRPFRWVSDFHGPRISMVLGFPRFSPLINRPYQNLGFFGSWFFWPLTRGCDRGGRVSDRRLRMAIGREQR